MFNLKKRLEELDALPLTFLVCCSRSGSLLLHSLLDDHPEILHIPFIFKFLDFYYENKAEINSLSGSKFAEKFVKFGNHQCLFDTNLSVHLKGSLGPSKQDRVILDKRKFCQDFHDLLPILSDNPRKILLAIVLCYNLQLKCEITIPKIIITHLHHGDWLFPEYLVNTSNVNPYQKNPPIFFPEKILSIVRSPTDTIESLKKLVRNYSIPENKKLGVFNEYLELLIQDWHRIKLIEEKKIDLKIVRLEDLRSHPKEQMEIICSWLNINPEFPTLTTPSFFGKKWWGDAFSKKTSEIHAPDPPILPSEENPDHQFVYSCINDEVKKFGYAGFPENQKKGVLKKNLNKQKTYFHSNDTLTQSILKRRKYFIQKIEIEKKNS